MPRLSGRGRLALTGLALLACLAALETLARTVYLRETDTALLAARENDGNISELLRYTSDPELYYELRPGLDTRHGGACLRTDARGLRVRCQPRPPGDLPGPPLRLAVIGASTTFGYKLPLEASYPELLVDGLEDLTGRPVELLNASVPAYNTAQQARLLDTLVLPWDPDLVLWHYDHRDAWPVLHSRTAVHLPPTHGDNLLGSALVKLVLRRLHQREVVALHGSEEDPGDVWEGYLRRGTVHEEHLRILERVAGRLAARGTPGVLVVFDAFLRSGRHAEVHHAGLHENLVPRLGQAGFRVIDLYRPLLDRMEEEGWSDTRAFWLSEEPLDGHPNQAGHAFLADMLMRWFVEHPEVLEMEP